MTTRILVFDNYDSFTYNIVAYLGELGAEVSVFRNDAISADEVLAAKPDGVLLSPGPGRPESAGNLMSVTEACAGTVPLLGVCLGHQAIAQHFGAKVVRAKRLMHGRTSPIQHDGKGLFEGIPNPFIATRYHSLIVDKDSLPPELSVSAQTDAGEMMALRHNTDDICAMQFHPESFLTEHGHSLLANWLRRCA